MLCTTLRDPNRLGDPRYVAEPKLDGQRAQIHVAEGLTVAAFSRPGYSLLAHAGLAWLRDVTWPMRQGVLDGELCAATGMEGILGVFEARKQRHAPLAFLAFDVLELEGHEVMSEPWTDRRKRLENLGAELPSAHVALITVADDAVQLWATWVGWGGEGIVLKDRRAPYRPGLRTPDWLKVKHRHTLAIRVEGGEPDSGALGRLGLGRPPDPDLPAPADPPTGPDRGNGPRPGSRRLHASAGRARHPRVLGLPAQRSAAASPLARLGG
jgi:bifunctional non-homologous end joining protein LigD